MEEQRIKEDEEKRKEEETRKQEEIEKLKEEMLSDERVNTWLDKLDFERKIFYN